MEAFGNLQLNLKSRNRYILTVLDGNAVVSTFIKTPPTKWLQYSRRQNRQILDNKLYTIPEKSTFIEQQLMEKVNASLLKSMSTITNLQFSKYL